MDTQLSECIHDIYRIHVTVNKKQINQPGIPRIHVYEMGFRIQDANIVVWYRDYKIHIKSVIQRL